MDARAVEHCARNVETDERGVRTGLRRVALGSAQFRAKNVERASFTPSVRFPFKGSRHFHIWIMSRREPRDVRFGSLAEVQARLRRVRSSPNSRHHSARSARPLSAKADMSAALKLTGSPPIWTRPRGEAAKKKLD